MAHCRVENLLLKLANLALESSAQMWASDMYVKTIQTRQQLCQRPLHACTNAHRIINVTGKVIPSSVVSYGQSLSVTRVILTGRDWLLAFCPCQIAYALRRVWTPLTEFQYCRKKSTQANSNLPNYSHTDSYLNPNHIF